MVRDIPDLSGWIIIVTGGNTGIGYEIIKAVLLKNAKVYMATRSSEKAAVAIARLKVETGGKEAIFLELDLASLSSVRNAANDFKQKESALHVLFNNGGVMNTPIQLLTTDGYDLQFGTNVIGHYVLFKELLTPLLAGAQSSQDKKARIVNMSSSAQMFIDTIHFDTIKDTPKRRKLGSAKLYMQSKLSQSWKHKNGSTKTYTLSIHVTFSSLGALTPLYAGVSSASGDLNGKYLIPWARIGKMRPEASDLSVGEKLWKWLEDETKS
ncbi:NAD -binding protein [Lentinula edodes]|uniref:NAD-binding protein n=1 Tax=Lentinula edodes TaxID=5353 RepID=A0A1Q3EPM9_LENED|nr:NAD -binding protein [Lentinula edodes]